NQESRLPPGSDFRRWVWITIAPFVTATSITAYGSNLAEFAIGLKSYFLLNICVKPSMFFL
ncbi:hypothetical protein, partial [Escherichia coli]|uniref:hypothetical protein n=1 Tax=Escherichia coli TaxID=562 RepID=UPI001BC89B79